MARSKLVYCLAYSSTLKMEAMFSSDTSVDFQQITQLHNTEGRIGEYPNLHCHNLRNVREMNYKCWKTTQLSKISI
jgi:hypothetical protein